MRPHFHRVSHPPPWLSPTTVDLTTPYFTTPSPLNPDGGGVGGVGGLGFVVDVFWGRENLGFSGIWRGGGGVVCPLNSVFFGRFAGKPPQVPPAHPPVPKNTLFWVFLETTTVFQYFGGTSIPEPVARDVHQFFIYFLII